jgi:hypothetical protein
MQRCHSLTKRTKDVNFYVDGRDTGQKKFDNLLDKKVQLDIAVLVQRRENVQYEHAALSYSEMNN